MFVIIFSISCAYYDAAKHLLRYARWLSLEYLSSYLTDDSGTADSSLPDNQTWNLTTSARERARQEMQSIVLAEPMEKSDPGDKYTWMESECEKLLKALRHQSDIKYMHYFIQPQYPGTLYSLLITCLIFFTNFCSQCPIQLIMPRMSLNRWTGRSVDRI